MSTSQSDLIDLFNRFPTLLYRYGGIVLYIIGNLGNTVSIIIFSQRSWRKNVCAFYFIFCLICDLIYVNSTLLGSIFISGFGIYAQNSNDFLCKIFFYISYVVSTYLSIILILASIDRLLISSQNIDTRLYSSRRLAYISLSGSFIIWSIFSLHSLIKVGIQEIYPTVFICYYDLSPSYLDFFSYSVLALAIAIPSILIILSILAFKNVRRIRAVPRQQRKQGRSMTKKDFQLLRCLYIYNVVYIFCTILLSSSLIYRRTLKYGIPSPFEQAFDAFLNSLGSFLHYMPYCISFFIFFGTSRAFRQELKRAFYKVMGRDAAGVHEEEHQPVEGPNLNNQEATRHACAISTVALQQ